MHYCFHHIPKTGGSSLRIRLEDRADKKQISKLDYAVGHNSTIRTPGTHFVWLRKPLDRDLSHYNYDVGKGDIEGATFVEHCHNLAGNFMILWLYENYLRYEPNANIETKYNTVRQALQTKIQKVFCLENFEDSWNQVADILKIDREPRLNTNRSDQDYKKYANRNQLSQEFIDWHKKYNRYDYQLYNEFCA
tara:strand:+ start:411 stop:986 length:576 start_codon:yes stop_codon:yes gene_type:complete